MSCEKCPSLCESRTQIVFPTPCAEGGILAIGEAPGACEDETGEGFCGTAGKKLDEIMATFGISRSEYGRANIVRCRPANNRKPTKEEIALCLPYLVETIKTCKPSVLLLVGGTPTAVFKGGGALFKRIQEAKSSTRINVDSCHPKVKELADLPMHAVPMPHTSPLAWNRFAPNARKWSSIGIEQVAKAIRLAQQKNKIEDKDEEKREERPEWI